jgi:8-oxo-dGTP pyrophosphatase MutT (NUDIX family)
LEIFSPIGKVSVVINKMHTYNSCSSVEDTHIEILFLKRQTRDGDLWSGNVCFPGGHRELGESLQGRRGRRE